MNNLKNRVEIGELKTTNSRRTLPLPDTLREMLMDIKQQKAEACRGANGHVVDSPFVFTTIAGKPFRPDSISQAFKRAAAKIGLPGMRLHDLRHPYVKPTTKKLFLPARCRPLGFTALFCFFSVFSRKEIV